MRRRRTPAANESPLSPSLIPESSVVSPASSPLPDDISPTSPLPPALRAEEEAIRQLPGDPSPLAASGDAATVPPAKSPRRRSPSARAAAALVAVPPIIAAVAAEPVVETPSPSAGGGEVKATVPPGGNASGRRGRGRNSQAVASSAADEFVPDSTAGTPQAATAEPRRATPQPVAETTPSALVKQQPNASRPPRAGRGAPSNTPPAASSTTPPPAPVAVPPRAGTTTTSTSPGTRGSSAVGTPAATAAGAASTSAPVRRRGPRGTMTLAPGVLVTADGTVGPLGGVPVLSDGGTGAFATTVVADDAASASTLGAQARTRGGAGPSGRVIVSPNAAPSGTAEVGLPLSRVVPAIVAPPPPPSYQPPPMETVARLADAKVVVQRGVVELMVNGEPHLPLWFFANTEDSEDMDAARAVAARQIRLAYEAGIRFFTLLAHLPWKGKSGERRFEPLDDALRLVSENAPDAFILPRLIFSPPVSWARANPNEMIRYGDDDEPGDVSIASGLFWDEEARDALRAAIEHMARGEHAAKIFGVYLEHGEWFHERGRGFDVSPANLAGFRMWLRGRYNDNRIALCAAWQDSTLTFETANIPEPLPVADAKVNGGASGNLFLTDREQAVADFHEYSSDIMAQTILYLANITKKASRNRLVVVVSYGYSLELSRPGSGHLALGTLLDSPDVDILTAPISYQGRAPGGSAPFAVPLDSIALAGKLFVSEDDTKTHLAIDETPDEAYNPKIADRAQAMATHWRNFGAATARGVGVSWMDLWGQGWLDDAALWQNIGRMRAVGEALAERRRANSGTKPVPAPDVAVIVDERSFFNVRDEDQLTTLLIERQRDLLIRSGARVGFYLLSDLEKPNFPDAKLLLFLNAFSIPESVRTAIRTRFQTNGRTLAWLYAPGSREESLAESAEMVGMQLRLQPWGAKSGLLITDESSPLTDGLKGQRIGEEARVNPSYYVTDPRAHALGEYVATGNIALAVRKHARYLSVFIGERVLTHALLRGLYRLAGVPLYSPDDDVAWVGDSIVSLHSAPGGSTTVYLPNEAVLFDIVSGETLASGGYGARFTMPARGTRLLFWGSAAEVVRLGGDPSAAPLGLSADELPPPATAFRFDEETGAPLVDLMAQALASAPPPGAAETGDDDVEDDDANATEDTDGAAEEANGDTNRKKRRRRRRGSRGPEDGDALEGDGATTEIVANGAADILANFGTRAGDANGNGRGAAQSVGRVVPSLDDLLPFSEAELSLPDEVRPNAAPLANDVLLFGDDEDGEMLAIADETTSGEAEPRARVRRRRRPQSPDARAMQEMSVEREVETFFPDAEEDTTGDVDDAADAPEPVVSITDAPTMAFETEGASDNVFPTSVSVEITDGEATADETTPATDAGTAPLTDSGAGESQAVADVQMSGMEIIATVPVLTANNALVEVASPAVTAADDPATATNAETVLRADNVEAAAAVAAQERARAIVAEEFPELSGGESPMDGGAAESVGVLPTSENEGFDALDDGTVTDNIDSLVAATVSEAADNIPTFPAEGLAVADEDLPLPDEAFAVSPQFTEMVADEIALADESTDGTENAASTSGDAEIVSKEPPAASAPSAETPETAETRTA